MTDDSTVEVEAMTTVRDNGQTHPPGERFRMERSLVPAHEQTRQVRRVADKQQRTPADKSAG